MRFIHTADWHLGRTLHGACLIDDQAHALDQVIDLARDARPEAVLVCGDVYDRAIPSADAVKLLDEVLSRLALDLGISTILIAGNHDSSQRLGFASRVLARGGIHVFGAVGREVESVILGDESGLVHFYPLPYAEPALVRERLDWERPLDHEEAMKIMVERILALHPSGERSVMLSHVFVTGGLTADSERPLSIGGADQVASSCFAGFDYVALGHLHRPQKAGEEHIRYSGALFKYSFSEADQSKGVHLVEMDARGCCCVEAIPLSPRRDVRCVEGLLKDVLAGPGPGVNAEDYVLVRLQDRGPILDVMGKLRKVYPNVLHVERPFFSSLTGEQQPCPDRTRLNDTELFQAFFREASGHDLSDEEAAAYESVVDELRRQEREAGGG